MSVVTTAIPSFSTLLTLLCGLVCRLPPSESTAEEYFHVEARNVSVEKMTVGVVSVRSRVQCARACLQATGCNAVREYSVGGGHSGAVGCELYEVHPRHTPPGAPWPIYTGLVDDLGKP